MEKDTAEKVDAFLKRKIGEINSRNRAEEGMWQNRIYKVLFFRRKEYGYNFDGIAYMILRSKIIEAVEKDVAGAGRNIEKCISEPVLRYVASTTKPDVSGYFFKKDGNFDYGLKANWVLLATECWKSRYPARGDRRFRLRKTFNRFNVSRKYVLNKIHLKENPVFKDILEDGDYKTLVEKYDIYSNSFNH